MPINTERKNLNLNKCCMNKEVSCWIEQDIIVPDTKPDAIKIVHVNVNPYVSDIEIMEDKIKVVGKLNYFVIYRVDDDKFNTRGLFMTYPYTEILNVSGVNKDMDITIIPNAKNIIYSLPNERKIAVKTEVAFRVKGKCCINVSLINSFPNDENIECKMCKGSFNNILQHKKSVIASKDDVMLPKEAEDFFEILDLRPTIVNTEYKESYNKIMVKGDIAIKIIYLSEDDMEKIKKVKINVPFSAMVEFENISDRSKFEIEYVIQDFNLRLNSDITSTKTMTAEYQIESNVTMYEEEEAEYVEDFYSQNRELLYENSRLDIVKKDFVIEKNIEVRETLSNVLPPNTNVIDYTVDTNSIIPTVHSNNNVHIEGNAKITILTRNNEDTQIDTRTIDLLVNADIMLENVDSDAKISIEISNNGINLTQNGNDLEIDMNIMVKNYVENVAGINIIDNITEDKLDLANLDSMNIYIVKPGDTLWAIAKKYKTSVDKLLKTNEDILDPNKINVGQKLLIIR